MRKILPLACLFLICFYVGCADTPQATPEQEQAERKETFQQLQVYTDAHYPQWKVKGFRLDDTESDPYGDDKKFYYVVLLSDGKTEKIVLIIKASFQTPEGNIQTYFYEPSVAILKRLKVKSIQRKYIEQLTEEKAAQDEAESQRERM